MTGAAPAIRVIGSQFSPESLSIREFLVRTRCPTNGWMLIMTPDVAALMGEFDIAATELPVVIALGTVLRRATPGDVAGCLGLTVESLPEHCFDLVVVGGGPAGLAAAVYGASEGSAHACRGDDGSRRAGRDELEDRELPGLSHGGLW